MQLIDNLAKFTRMLIVRQHPYANTAREKNVNNDSIGLDGWKKTNIL